MCENYKYMLQLKPQYDIKYQKTGIRTQMIYLCEVKDVANGIVKLHYDDTRFNLLVKECGKCHVCRYKKASIKACQAQCEYKTVGKGSFITLTFGDKAIQDYLQKDSRFASMSKYKKDKYRNYLQWTLEKREFQLFMKRLRYKVYQQDLYNYSLNKGYLDNIYKKNGKKRNKIIKNNYYDYNDFVPRRIRFMHCGEYGENKGRPHHHAIIYGIDFSFDKSVVRYSWRLKRNTVVHFNNMLSDLWQFGDVTTDKVNYQTCNYVARYVTKKIVNKNKEYIDKDISGFVYSGRLPEYCTQSNRNGLGYDYYMQHAKKINSDLQLSFKNQDGQIKYVPIPQYFKNLMRKHHKTDFLRMQRLSIEKQLEFSEIPPDILTNRMDTDLRKGKQWSQLFVGSYEKSLVSFEKQKYLSNQYKVRVFNDLNNFKAIMLSSYSDTDFVPKVTKRIECYKNFEKYRKSLRTVAINEYVNQKFTNPQKVNCMFTLYNKIKQIKMLENPFTCCNLNNGYGVLFTGDIFEKWKNYNRKECKC